VPAFGVEQIQNGGRCHGNKSEDFCIWRPFWILVSMVTAAILNFFQPPKKLPHTTVEIPTNVHEA
jgi:hypothetical protein